MKRKHLIDVTEVFRNLKVEKKFRIAKLGFYVIFFALVIAKYVPHWVHNYHCGLYFLLFCQCIWLALFFFYYYYFSN